MNSNLSTNNKLLVFEFIQRIFLSHQKTIEKFIFSFFSRSNERENFIQCGSGFGISCNGLKYIVTALHVLENIEVINNNLLITHATGKSYLIKDLSKFFTIKNSSLDYFVIEMPNLINFGMYYEIQKSSTELQIDSFKFAIASGFPNSKNKRRIKLDCTNKICAIHHFAQIKNSSSDFLFLEHDGIKAWDNNFAQNNAINLRGVSGGTVFAVGGINYDNNFISYCAQELTKEMNTGIKFQLNTKIYLVGMLIEAKNGSHIKCARSSRFLSDIFETSLKCIKIRLTHGGNNFYELKSLTLNKTQQLQKSILHS